MDHKWLSSWNLAKAERVSCQSGLSFARRHRLLKLSIIVFSLLSSSLLSPSSPALSPCSFQLRSAPFSSPPFLWQEILTIAGQSFPPSQEAAGSGLAEPECSAPVGVCQRPANKGCCSPPQRLCCAHTAKLEVKSLNTVITRGWGL